MIVTLLWVLFKIVLLVGVFLAILWLLRYAGLPIPPQVEKFGLILIAILALIWLVSVFLGAGGSVSTLLH